MSAARVEIRDADHPRWRGQRYNGPTAEARARRELDRAVDRAGRWLLVDRDSGRVLAVNR